MNPNDLAKAGALRARLVNSAEREGEPRLAAEHLAYKAAPKTLHHRLGSAVVELSDAHGTPLANTAVTVTQVSHAYGWGNIGFDFVGLANGEVDGQVESPFGGAKPSEASVLAPLWFDLFNVATLPFYWRGFEPERGKPDTERLMKAAAWFVERGVTVKGHPLVWHTLAPQWLLGLEPDEVEATIRARITRDVTAFTGVIDLWDAINEVVILPVFTAEPNAITDLAKIKGRVEMVRMAFDQAREANPKARLVLNDFDLSHDYENLIEEVLAAGIEVDAIGVQTHMHQGFRGEDQINNILDRFGRFGLPVQMTETTLVSGDLMPSHIVDLNDYQVPEWPTTPAGEERQAQELVRHFSTVFAHPATESLTYWGIADAGAWLGAPAGLVRSDGTPKPGYEALLGLIKRDWWMTSTEVVTDHAGRIRIESFKGDYNVTTAHGAAAAVSVS